MVNNKSSSDTSGKNLVCVNDNYILPKDTLKNALNNSYEKGCSDSEDVGFGKAWSFLLSSAITLFITTVTFIFTINWSIFSMIVTAVFALLFFICLVTGIISLILSRKTTKTMTKQRDSSTRYLMKTLDVTDKDL